MRCQDGDAHVPLDHSAHEWRAETNGVNQGEGQRDALVNREMRGQRTGRMRLEAWMNCWKEEGRADTSKMLRDASGLLTSRRPSTAA
jgi:hypothetical protein